MPVNNDMLTLDLVASLAVLQLKDAGLPMSILPAFAARLLRGYAEVSNRDPAELCRLIANEFDNAARTRGATVTKIRPATDGEGN